MPISVDCPACGCSFRVRDRYAGETVPCKECRQSVAVPATGEQGSPWVSSKPVPLEEPADLLDFLDDEPPPGRGKPAGGLHPRSKPGSPAPAARPVRNAPPAGSRPGVRPPSAFADDLGELDDRPGRSRRREPVKESSGALIWALVGGGVLTALGVLVGGIWFLVSQAQEERKQRQQQELVREQNELFHQPILPPVDVQANPLEPQGDVQIPQPVPFGQNQPKGPLIPGGDDVAPNDQNNRVPFGPGNFPRPGFPPFPNFPQPPQIPVPIRPPQPQVEPERVTIWKFKPDPREVKINNSRLAQLGIPGGNLNGVLFASVPSEFAVMGKVAFGSELKLFNVNTGKVEAELPQEINASQPFTLDPDGVYLVGRTREPAGTTTLAIWSFKSGKQERTLQISPDRVTLNLVEFAGSNRLAVSFRDFKNGNRQLVQVYDLGSGEKTLEFDLNSRDIQRGQGLDVSPGGKYLAVLGTRLMIYELSEGDVVADLPIPDQSSRNSWSPEAISFSPDSRQLAVIMARAFHTRIICWDMEQGEIRHDNTEQVFHHNHFYFWSGFQGRKIQFLKDNQHLLILGNYVVHAPTGKKIHTFSDNGELLMDKSRQLFGSDYLVHTWRQGAQVSVIATPIPYEDIEKAKPGG